MGVLALLSFYTFSVEHLGRSRTLEDATMVLENQMEGLRRADFSSISPGNYTVQYKGKSFSVSRSVEDVAGYLKKVTVTVQGQGISVRCSTYIMGNSSQ